MSFNLYRIPPNFDICDIHHEAAFLYDEKQQYIDKCPCCDRQVGTKKVSLCTRTRSFIRINQEIPLYFSYIKIIILILILMIVTVGTQRMFSQVKIVKFKIEIPSYDVYHLQIGFVQQRTYVKFIIFVIFTLLILFVRGYLKKLKYKVQAATNSISDRSVMLTNVYPQVTKNDIINKFQDNDLINVILTYKVNKFSNYLQRIYKLNKKYCVARQKRKEKQAELLKQEIVLSMKELKFIYSNMKNQKNRLDIVFLTFATEEARNLFLERLFYKLCTCCSPTAIQNQHITVIKGPDPEDIDWLNLQYNYWTKKIHRLACYYMCFSILIFGFMFQYVVSIFPIQDFYASIIKNIIMLIVNYFIINLLQFTTINIEKHETNTNKVLSLIKKLTFFIFLNLSMSPLSIYLYYSLTNQKIDQNIQPFDQLCLSLVIISVSNIIKPFMQYFNVQRIMKFINYHHQKNNQDCQMTQEEANQEFQPIAFPLASFYAIFLSSLFLTAFFMSCFQIFLVLDVFACIFLYYVSKYMLLRVCKQPIGLDHQISVLCQKMLTFAIPLYWIGQQIMSYFIVEHDFQNFIDYLINFTGFQFVQLSIIGLSFIVFPKILSKISHKLAQYQDISQSFIQKASKNVNRLTYQQVNSMKKLQNQYKRFFDSIK